MKERIDVRTIMTGNDGKLFLHVNNEPVLLAEVKEYEIKANFANIEYKPVGDVQQYAIPDKVKFTLNFTGAGIRDDLTIAPLLKSIKETGAIPTYDFQASAARNTDGKEQRLVLKLCLPDGDFDLMTLKAGEVVTRQQSFVVNEVPYFIDWIDGSK